MSVVINRFDKPKNCQCCPFNNYAVLCSITNGSIDRDDYSCDIECPIKPLPKGHWIKSKMPLPLSDSYKEYVRCSVCKAHWDVYGFNFCPNCGADMRGGE